MTRLTSLTHNLANQKNWIFLLGQISPSASSSRGLGTRLELSLKKPAKFSRRLWVISVLVSLGKSMLYFLRLGYFFYKMVFTVTFSPCIRYRAKARDQWSPHSLLVKVKWHLSERRLWQDFNLGNRTQFLIFKNHPDILHLNGSNVRSMVYHE